MFKNRILFYVCMLAIAVYTVSCVPVKEQQVKELNENDAVDDKEMEAFEASVIKYLNLLSRKKLAQELNARRNNYEESSDDADETDYRVAKRNPEFTNSLMLYSKLFRKLDQIGKRR